MRTTLEIINEMLASTGTAPLTTNDINHPSYVTANNKLTHVARAVLGMGWWFNRITITLKQDINGHVILPADTMHCDPVDRTKKYVVRGTKLFNLTANSEIIGEDVETVWVVYLDIPLIPSQAQDYICSRAVYEYYRDEGGSNPKLTDYRNDRDNHWIQLRVENARNTDTNWFDGPSAAAMARR